MKLINVVRQPNRTKTAWLVVCTCSLSLCHECTCYLLTKQGDTLQSIRKDLDRVMQSGSFTFKSSEGQGSGRVIATLQFVTSLDPPSDGNNQLVLPDEWRPEKISNFVTQLGFLDQGDKDLEMCQQIKQLLHINEVCL